MLRSLSNMADRMEAVFGDNYPLKSKNKIIKKSYSEYKSFPLEVESK